MNVRGPKNEGDLLTSWRIRLDGASYLIWLCRVTMWTLQVQECQMAHVSNCIVWHIGTATVTTEGVWIRQRRNVPPGRLVHIPQEFFGSTEVTGGRPPYLTRVSENRNRSRESSSCLPSQWSGNYESPLCRYTRREIIRTSRGRNAHADSSTVPVWHCLTFRVLQLTPGPERRRVRGK